MFFFSAQVSLKIFLLFVQYPQFITATKFSLLPIKQVKKNCAQAKLVVLIFFLSLHD
jgi:hypothetical protein